MLLLSVTFPTDYFNPRPREEGDFEPAIIVSRLFVISIHALVKRATNNAKYDLKRLIISIHALVKRATSLLLFSFLIAVISIHALVKRATL